MSAMPPDQGWTRVPWDDVKPPKAPTPRRPTFTPPWRGGFGNAKPVGFRFPIRPPLGPLVPVLSPFAPSNPKGGPVVGSWDKSGWYIWLQCGRSPNFGPIRGYRSCWKNMLHGDLPADNPGERWWRAEFYQHEIDINGVPVTVWDTARVWSRYVINGPDPEVTPGVQPAVVMPGIEAMAQPYNPNVMRNRPDLIPGFGTPLVPNVEPGMEPGLEPALEPAVDPTARVITATGLAPGISPGSRPEPAMPIPVNPRVPPKENEKERKTISKSKLWMARFFKILDQVSENAEIVDAFYDALPEPVKRKWDCNRNTPFIDTAGQYGLDNADCKARALWHNWHQVDIETAVENLIKNYIEDAIIGYIHKYLPKNTINAFQDAMKQGGKELNDFLDEYIDFDLIFAEKEWWKV